MNPFIKTQKLISISILFALISAGAFNCAFADDTLSELQGAAENSNPAIAFDGSKVYPETELDSTDKFNHQDNYNENNSNQTEAEREELGNNKKENFSAASSLNNSKTPSKKMPDMASTLNDSNEKNESSSSKFLSKPGEIIGGIAALILAGILLPFLLGNVKKDK